MSGAAARVITGTFSTPGEETTNLDTVVAGDDVPSLLSAIAEVQARANSAITAAMERGKAAAAAPGSGQVQVRVRGGFSLFLLSFITFNLPGLKTLIFSLSFQFYNFNFGWVTPPRKLNPRFLSLTRPSPVDCDV